MMKYFIIKLKKRNKIVGLTHDKSNFILYNLDNLKNLNKIDENMILNSEARATLRLDSYHSKILKENEIVSDIYKAEVVEIILNIETISNQIANFSVMENKINVKNFSSLLVDENRHQLDALKKMQPNEQERSKSISVAFLSPDQLFYGTLALKFIRVAYKSKKRRTYHNEEHLIHGWKSLTETEKQKLSKEQIFAWIFHDFYYDVNSNDNEEKSALALKEYNEKANLKLNIEKAMNVIIDTINHIPTIEESKIILDLDLLYLGEDQSVFLDCRKRIEKEYAFKYTRKEILNGSISFFEDLLKQKTIYSTPRYKLLYEKKARKNIKSYIAQLYSELFIE